MARGAILFLAVKGLLACRPDWPGSPSCWVWLLSSVVSECACEWVGAPSTGFPRSLELHRIPQVALKGTKDSKRSRCVCL